jgi:steroid 5-alpha reductase family enzyme
MQAESIKLFLVALGFSIVLMTAMWVLSRMIHNIGVIDIAWSFGFAPVVIYAASVASGNPAHRWFIAAMVTLWSVRLGSHVLIRVARLHPKEDVRYEALRAEWGAKLDRKLFWFFEFQAVLIAVLAVPFLIVCLNTQASLSPFEYAGAAIWLLAWAGESLADHQLKVFKADPKNKGRVCQAGMWHYSRHPNYFCEWMVWVGFCVFALGSPWGWTALYCPALMLFFLLKVTGIPMTEELSVKSKGEAYREYQRTTSGFVPWFRKSK